MQHPLLSAEEIRKDFSGVEVLKGVSITVHAGEIVGLIGENGAGKSTLMKILSGIYRPSSGRLAVDGSPLEFHTPKDAKTAGISLVPQEFNLCAHLTVAENVFLGAEPRKGALIDDAAMAARAAELLAELGSAISPRARIDALSAAEKQLVEICKALAFDARLLILDEPTTVLTSIETARLFALMRALKARGAAMVYISHKLAEVKEICDRIYVLRDGELVRSAAAADMEPADMASAMVGRELSQVFPARTARAGAVALELRGVSSPGVLEDVSFAVREGEILGLAGLVGAGRTEVAEAIMGLRPRTGSVAVAGAELKPRSPRAAVAAGVGYLSEDRQGSGVLTAFGVAENATLVSLPSYAVGPLGLVDGAKERSSAQAWRERFGIKVRSLDQGLEQLSGGNQQKVSLAKTLDPAPRVLLADEPTRGVDVAAKQEIYRFIAELASRGLAVVLISSELEEILGLCDRVVVMREGAVAGELNGEGLSQSEIMFLATGVREGAKA